MKKILSLLLVFLLTMLMNGCSVPHFTFMDEAKTAFTEEVKFTSTEFARDFYNKVNESAKLLDLVATDVCAAWKDATYDYDLSTKEVNDAIELAKDAHEDNILRINDLDKDIRDLFDKAKDETNDYSIEFELKNVMTAYSEYKDSVINANEALDSHGYMEISFAKESLDRALQNLYVEL